MNVKNFLITGVSQGLGRAFAEAAPLQAIGLPARSATRRIVVGVSDVADQ